MKLTIEGNIAEAERQMKATLQQTKSAIVAGTREGTEALKKSLRADAKAAGLGRLANTWQSKFYRNDGFDAAGLVYSKAPKPMRAFAEGAVIKANGAKYLAIPTNFNRARGRRRARAEKGRGQWANVLISPEEMVRNKRFTFTRPRKDGPGLIWFIQVTKAQAKTRRGIKTTAYAGGQFLLGSGRRARTEPILEAGAVPMFVLVPQVTIKKRINPDIRARRAAEAMPARVLAALQKAE